MSAGMASLRKLALKTHEGHPSNEPDRTVAASRR